MKNGFRLLDAEELQYVAGGEDTDPEIIVTGTRQSSNDYLVSFQIIDSWGTGAYGGGIFCGYPSGFDPNDGDDDNVDDTIIVNGPPRMADEWGELDFEQKLIWLSAYIVSGGDEQYADIVTGTDLSGQNPDNPYQSEEDWKRDMEDGFEGAERMRNDPNYRLQ